MATPQMPRMAAKRCAQVKRSAGGPAAGSRQVTKTTARHRQVMATMPGRMPAMNSLPMSVSVMIP
ncbi:hypothetical protein D9M68_854110 [compost metagenome]